MKENEASVLIGNIPVNGKDGCYSITEYQEAKTVAVQALEEIQQYRAIGTPEELQTMKEHGGFTGVELANIAAMQMKLKEYEAIGTPEECREAVEKIPESKSGYEKVTTSVKRIGWNECLDTMLENGLSDSVD